jgi:hypothetical protein
MYSFDTNINTAIERQADRVRAVQAYGSRRSAAAQSAPSQSADGQGGMSRMAGKATLALAAAAPIVVLVVSGLLR